MKEGRPCCVTAMFFRILQITASFCNISVRNKRSRNHSSYSSASVDGTVGRTSSPAGQRTSTELLFVCNVLPCVHNHGPQCWSQTFWTRPSSCRCHHGGASTSFKATAPLQQLHHAGHCSAPQTSFPRRTNWDPLVSLQHSCTSTSRFVLPTRVLPTEGLCTDF